MQYDAGKWSPKGKPSLGRLIKSWACRLMGLDAMGYWYEPDEIADLAGNMVFKRGLSRRICIHTDFMQC